VATPLPPPPHFLGRFKVNLDVKALKKKHQQLTMQSQVNHKTPSNTVFVDVTAANDTVLPPRETDDVAVQ